MVQLQPLRQAWCFKVSRLDDVRQNVTSALSFALPPAFNSSYSSSNYSSAGAAAKQAAGSGLSTADSTAVGVWDLFSNFGQSLSKFLTRSVSVSVRN